MNIEDTLDLPAGCESKKNQLSVIVKESGLEKTKAEIILSKFQNFFEMASEWERKAKQIIVTDESQEFEISQARAGRLLLQKRRCEIENTRKELKEQSLREGKAIDGIANVLKGLIVPIEKHLEKQEKFAEFKKAEIERLKAEKIEKERIEAENKRIADEALERERIRIENEKLRKEAQEREEQILKERSIYEAKLAEERRIQESKLAEERKKAEAERRIQAEIAEEERRKFEEQLSKQRAETERLRNQLTCPKCGHKFNKEEECQKGE